MRALRSSAWFVSPLRTILTLMLGCVSFCAGGEPFVRDDIVLDPVPEHFSVCHGFTCALVSQLGLDAAEWASVVAVFAAPVTSAEEERSRIAEAIARFETIVGRHTGTSDDRAENQSGDDPAYQMDCIDESTNTTTYLKMLIAKGYVTRHRVEDPVTRGFLIFGWPHTTAVMREIASDVRWAVDSWFFENGRPPVIVPLEVWRQTRWRPEGAR